MDMKNENKKISWQDITLDQFMKISELDLNEVEDQFRLIEIVYNVDLSDIAYAKFSKYLTDLSFMNNEVPKTIIRDEYIINERKYKCNRDITSVSVSQYMDFVEYTKTNDLSKVLSVFMVPEGHEYADGYDINQVYDDIKCMSIVDVYAISNFFFLLLKSCVQNMKDYLRTLMSDPKLKDLREAVLKSMDYFCSLEQ